MNSLTLTTGILVSLIGIAATAPGAPPAVTKPEHGKPDAAALVASGHALFLSNCSPCHGANAEGDDGPSLHHKSLPDTAVETAIENGFKGEMPAFSKLKPLEIKFLTAYVHSLQ